MSGEVIRLPKAVARFRDQTAGELYLIARHEHSAAPVTGPRISGFGVDMADAIRAARAMRAAEPHCRFTIHAPVGALFPEVAHELA